MTVARGGALMASRCEPAGHFSVISHSDGFLLAPDEGPRRTARGGTPHRAFFLEGLLTGGVRGDFEFSMDFMAVGVGQQLVQ